MKDANAVFAVGLVGKPVDEGAHLLGGHPAIVDAKLAQQEC
jgi:hypothetical protein